ncbi:hypothetical protein ACOI9M_10145 [Corynebacterium striatum]|uniref:hypothetical protein n=1 Tax=Corynebacterium striatum TaxID=43770 RepID=UPI003B638B8E
MTGWVMLVLGAAWTIINLLGPWPWYILAEIGAVAGAWAAMTWPWETRRLRRSVRAVANRL